MKNTMIKGGIGNHLKSGTFLLNIVVFPFTNRKRTVHVSKTSESLKHFALTTYFAALHIYFHFFFYCIMHLSQQFISCMTLRASLRYAVNGIYCFVLMVYFTVLNYMFLKHLVKTILFGLINKF